MRTYITIMTVKTGRATYVLIVVMVLPQVEELVELVVPEELEVLVEPEVLVA